MVGGGGGVGEQRGSVVVVREEVLEGDLVALNLFGTSDVAVAVSVPDIAGHLGNCALARPLSIVGAFPALFSPDQRWVEPETKK